jgi:hypothetical protein
MITHDSSLIANWRPKAQKSIERALQMAQQASPQKKATLRRLKNEIDGMPEDSRQPKVALQPETSSDVLGLPSDRRGGGGLLEDLQRAHPAGLLPSALGAPKDAVSRNRAATPPLKKSSAKPAAIEYDLPAESPADVDDLFKESDARLKK